MCVGINRPQRCGEGSAEHAVRSCSGILMIGIGSPLQWAHSTPQPRRTLRSISLWRRKVTTTKFPTACRRAKSTSYGANGSVHAPRLAVRVNTPVSGRLQFRISGESALCEDVRCRGFDSFAHLAEHVRALPYGRTANSEDPLAVLQERRGTCSAKHRFLATVAQDCGHSEVRLTVGIYEMSEENTPGVGRGLGTASLTRFPQAHCYL